MFKILLNNRLVNNSNKTLIFEINIWQSLIMEALSLSAYQQTAIDVVKKLEVNIKTGLTISETKKRLAEYGENTIRESKKKNNLQRFFEQFKDIMILILIAAAAISFFIALYEGENFYESALIILIVFINAILGTIQESKAEKALEALKKLSSPHARVVRDGENKIIEASQLVPGDIILLEAGDFVPADARLISSANLKSEESALTGESVPVEKEASMVVQNQVPLGDRRNMVFSSCAISSGRATAVVTATGMKTEIGKIADLLDREEEGQTPLQFKLARLGKYLGLAALAACAVIFAIGLLEGMPVIEIFMISVALAVSAIPEGLPAIVTVVLAMGVQRMVRRKAIIRRLPAVETLGSASVICSDKTGTLTENKMTLIHLYLEGKSELEKVSMDNSPAAKNLLLLSTLCSDGRIGFENGSAKYIGDPTETAIIQAAHNNGLLKELLEEKYPRLAELPFDSERKLMTTVNSINGDKTVIVKGAFDNLAKRCTRGDIDTARRFTDNMSKQALRVLGVAYKEIAELPPNPGADFLESDLTFLGLLSMIDPPRSEARKAVSTCRQAGIRPVMITGDNILTASAIASELGILREGDRAVNIDNLEIMSDQELKEQVSGVSVYARVSPADKIRIVRAWQSTGNIVAMTGDGVNDAPALKAADIGCAMGITGTDVAKGAADMVLTDDNFATIVDAVREGRGIYDNIRKVVGFLLGTNIGELLTVFLAMIIWKISPLLSVQLLWINLVTDSFPAIALGMEPVEDNVMARKPRPREESIFTGGFGLRIILQGIMFAILTLLAFTIGRNADGSIIEGRTMAFIVLALSQIFHAFNMRSNRSLFMIGIFSNKIICFAALFSTFMVALVVFMPSLAYAFRLARLSPEMYLTALLLSIIPIPVIEIAKLAGLIKKE